MRRGLRLASQLLRPRRRSGRRLPRRSTKCEGGPMRRGLRLASQLLRLRRRSGLYPFTATGFRGNSRPRRLKIAAPSGCKSRVADQPSLRATAWRASLRSELRHGGPAFAGAAAWLASLCSSSFDSASRRVVHREKQTDSTQDRTALGVQVSPRRPAFAPSFGSAATLECQPAKRTGPRC